ncbi:MAG: hypothetical protein MEQ84_07935 [Mesorhizobium sp.]|nr:hypothetical protein [Mesorhizobium sp.]
MRIALAALMTITSAGWALALTEEQENVLNHISEAMAISVKCPSMGINGEMAALAGIMFDIPMDRPSVQAELHARVPGKIMEIDHHEPAIICGVGRLLYGVNGGNVKGLLVDN